MSARKYNQFIVMFDVLFGAYGTVFLLFTLYGWARGEAPWFSPATVVGFLAVNMAFSKISVRSRTHQLLIEKIRIWLAPVFLCPLTMVLAAKPLGPLWEVYLIHAMGGSVIHALGPKSWQKIAFYLAQLSGSLIAASWLFLANPNWYAILVQAVTIAFVGAGVAKLFMMVLQGYISLEKSTVEREIAEKANQAKSLFLANISHELRTPMHGILSFARFGQAKVETASKETVKRYFDEIYDSGSRLMLLLNDLLDLSKLESGKFVFSMREGNLADLARDTLGELEILAKERDIGLELAVGAATPEGIFDRERIQQVLRNLVSNAIKFSEKGTVIHVAVNRIADGLRCEVTNTGVEIPETELGLIFDKFFQSSKTRTGAGGTGLGLSICQQIVQQHHGKIWAENSAAKKVTFIFELPVLMEQSKAA